MMMEICILRLDIVCVRELDQSQSRLLGADSLLDDAEFLDYYQPTFELSREAENTSRMKFNRLKTKRAYHDSIITGVNWPSVNDLEIIIALDTHWNKSSPETCAIQFLRVRNRTDIEAVLQQIASNQTHRRYIAEIVAFRRYGKTSYILDTTPHPPLVIDCASYIEI